MPVHQLHHGIRSVVLVLFGSWVPMGLAQNAMNAWFSPELGRLQTNLRYEFEILPAVDVSRQDTDFSARHYNLSMLLPVWNREHSELALTPSFGVLDIHSGAILPDSRQDLPDELYKIDLGGVYRRKLDGDRILGLQVSLSSPSDKPFNSLDEVSVNATGMLRVPAAANDAWWFFLNYSDRRDFLPYVPLPGVAYQWNPGPEFRGVFGLPFSMVNWQPMEDWTLEASYFVPRTIHTRLRYQLLEKVSVYSGFRWYHDSYLRSERDEDQDRLFFYQKKAMSGIIWEISESFSIDLQGGYGFDRFLYEGEDYGDRGDDRISLSDGWFGQVSGTIRF